MKRLSLIFLFALSACGPTYNREKVEQNIKDLAKKEYKLDVSVEEAGDTIGLKFTIKNLLGELVAPDQLIWTQMEDLMTVLHRVALSLDHPPKFVVLDVMDENNNRVHLVFTRSVLDLQKAMAQALSRNQFLDRLVIEFVIGNKRTIFDPSDTDLVRFMMMAMDTDPSAPKVNSYHFQDVSWTDFLAKVAAKTAQRSLRDDKNVSENFLLRDVTGKYMGQAEQAGRFKILVDLGVRASAPAGYEVLEKKIFPMVAKQVADVFKSYKYESFTEFSIVEKNSGKVFVVSGR